MNQVYQVLLYSRISGRDYFAFLTDNYNPDHRIQGLKGVSVVHHPSEAGAWTEKVAKDLLESWKALCKDVQQTFRNDPRFAASFQYQLVPVYKD